MMDKPYEGGNRRGNKIRYKKRRGRKKMPATQLAATEEIKDTSTPVVKKGRKRPPKSRQIFAVDMTRKDTDVPVCELYVAKTHQGKETRKVVLHPDTDQPAQFSGELMKRCKARGMSDEVMRRWMEET